jgi:hypothetical protein
MDLWGVALGGLLALAGGFGAQWLRGRQEAGLDAVKRADDRRLGLDKFQLENLIALQDQVNVVARTLGAIAAFDSQLAQAGRPWGSQPVPADLVAAGQESVLGVQTLASRVVDPGLRDLCRQLVAVAVAQRRAATREEVGSSFLSAADLATRIIERSGELILQTFSRAEV